MKSGKYLLSFLLITGACSALRGQAAQAAPTPTADLSGIMTYVLGAAGALLFIVAMVYMIRVNQFLYKRLLSLQAAQSGVALPAETADATAAGAGEPFWEKIRKQYWEDAVPLEREHEIISHHEFDGIRELDNSLPPWWVNMFILTVIWGVIYMFYYHWGGNGPSSAEEYKMEVETAIKQQRIALAGQANAVDESNVTALTASGDLGEGELIYKTSCLVCHGAAGEGGVGPNLTDEYWLHGGGIKNVFKTIKYGVPEKGMVAWSSTLKPADMQKVASFILTMQGTNPPNPKAPQGDIWKPEAGDEPAPADAKDQKTGAAG
jgi:cytochrome c oxidase cbb3-type subunit 3